MSEDRLTDIEVKIAFQEDTLQELNQLIYQQQRQLDQLEAALNALAGRMAEMAETVPVSDQKDEKPPHY